MMSLKVELILRSGVQDRDDHPCAAGAAFVVIVYVIVTINAGTRILTEDTIDTLASICQI